MSLSGGIPTGPRPSSGSDQVDHHDGVNAPDLELSEVELHVNDLGKGALLPQDSRSSLSQIHAGGAGSGVSDTHSVKHIEKLPPWLLRIGKFLGISDCEERYDRYVTSQIEKIVNKGPRLVEAHAAYKMYEPSTKNATTPLEIPTNLLENPKKAFHNKTVVAQIAARKDLHKNIDSKETSIGTMLAYSFERTAEGKVKLVPGEVTPTSFLGGLDPHKAEREHLKNAYAIVVNGKPYGIIRTGVIDNKQRMEEFVALLREVRTQIIEESKTSAKPLDEKFKLRVMSQQLNHFEQSAEKQMIENQHKWMAAATIKMKNEGIGEVMHINTPSNRWYLASKRWYIPGFIAKGEKLSREQNLDSWGTKIRWMKETKNIDMPSRRPRTKLESIDFATALITLKSSLEAYKTSVPSFKESATNTLTYQDLISANLARTAELEERIEDPLMSDYGISQDKKEIKQLENELKVAREAQKTILTRDYLYLGIEERKLKSAVKPLNADDKNKLQTVSLMKKLLGSQLEIKGQSLDKGQEGMIIHLLNHKLGVTSQVNCKSGLDRSAIWHSIKLALEQLLSNPKKFDSAFAMVMEWEPLTHKLNNVVSQFGLKKFNAWLDGDVALENQDRAEIEKLLGFDSKTTQNDVDQLKNKFRDVIEFRKLVVNNMIRISVPITLASTGLLGLKWSPGTWQENPVALNFIPSHVHVNKYFGTVDGKPHEIKKFAGIVDGKKVEVEAMHVEEDKDKNFFVMIDGNRVDVKPKVKKAHFWSKSVVPTDITSRKGLVKLVRYHGDGEVSGMARAGQYLLTKLSGLRGS